MTNKDVEFNSMSKNNIERVEKRSKSWLDSVPIELHGHRKKLNFICRSIKKYCMANKKDPSKVNVIEIGCSNGRNISFPLAEMGFIVKGIDLHAPSIAWAEANNNYSNASFICQDFFNFASHEKFDVVILSDILEHVENPLKCMRLAVELLIQGGILLICVPNGYGPYEIEQRLMRITGMDKIISSIKLKIRKAIMRPTEGERVYNFDSGHLQHFRMRDIYKLATDVRMRIVKKENGALFGGDLTYLLGTLLPIITVPSLKLADILPHRMVTTWYFCLSEPFNERSQSNQKARDTWENKAVGSQRAIATAGTAEYYRQIKKYRYGYETPFIPKFFNFAGMKDKRVLEVGVGNGIDAVEMMRNGAFYKGIDITSNHIILAQRYVELERKKGRNLFFEGIIEGDLLETELSDTFDVIYSFGVLHHISHEFEYLVRLRQLLAEDGRLMVAVYNSFSIFNLWMILTWLFINRMHNKLTDWQSYLSEGSNLGDPVVIKIRNRREIQKVIEAAGYKVLRYKRKGFVQNYIPGIGKFLDPDGIILNLFASLMGWYHCFICCADRK